MKRKLKQKIVQAVVYITMYISTVYGIFLAINNCITVYR